MGTVIDQDLLAGSPFFSAFRGREREMVAALLQVQNVQAGHLLFVEGEPGLTMYVVVEGTLRVTATAAADSTTLDVLGPGDAVGEMALLLGESRSAACRAVTDARVGALTKADFDALLAQQPGLAVALGRLMAQRLRRANQLAVPSLLATQMLGLGDRDVVTLGRDLANQVVLSSPAIAPLQAEIVRLEGRSFLARNLAPTEGESLIVNGRTVAEARVAEGDTLKIGPYRFILRETLGARDGGVGSVWLHADHLWVKRGEATLLRDISLDIRPGEFVAITGASGAGKSTLLNALNGFRPATEGRVIVNGVSLYDNLDIFRRAVGYVPQDDIVHPELTVARALHYTARLRVPNAPTTARAAQQDALNRRIERTLKLLTLSEQRDLPIASLSGGQRKRASIGVELITEPSLFCLDEPTSGLDPATEVRMMALLRQISERGQTVIMVTHATETIGMCHRVIFLARGGYLAFTGTPSEALAYFQVDAFDAIYSLLDHEHTPAYWAAAFASSSYATSSHDAATQPPSSPPATRASQRQRGRVNQFVVLTQRYAEILRRDKRTLTLVCLQTPLIGLLMLAIFPQGVFSPDPNVGNGQSSLMVLFILISAATFFGASNSSKELVKERAVFRRERLVNLRLVPYIVSKVSILGAVGVAQSIVLVAICSLGGLLPPGGGPGMLAALVGVLSVTYLAGTGLGLLLSALAANADFATSMVPLILLPELMFSGVLVPINQMSFLSSWLAQVMVTKWSFELLGRVTNLTDVWRAQGSASSDVLRANYQASFAAAGWAHIGALIGFTALFLTGATVALEARNRAA